jgi:hypothetical protein
VAAPFAEVPALMNSDDPDCRIHGEHHAAVRRWARLLGSAELLRLLPEAHLLAGLSAQKLLWYFGDRVSDFSEPRASGAVLPVHAVASKTKARQSARVHTAQPQRPIEAGLAVLAGRAGASRFPFLTHSCWVAER